MTDRYRRISLQQQLRHRTSHDLTATDHTRVRPAYFNAVVVEEFDDAGWSARHEDWSAKRQSTDVDRMKPVDVFPWIDRFDDRGFVNLRRQRKLRQNPVNIIARV